MRLTFKPMIGIAVCLVLTWLPARAQVAGSLHSARPLKPQTTDVGGYLALFDGDGRPGTPIAVFGQVRHGLFSAGDGGLKFGLIDSNTGKNDVGLLLVADMQWALLAPRWGDPFWLSFGPEFAMMDKADERAWAVGGNMTASYDLDVRETCISLYARFNLRLEIIDYDKAGRASGTDLELGFNPGAVWEVSDIFDVVAELQFDDWFGLLAGINFRI